MESVKTTNRQAQLLRKERFSKIKPYLILAPAILTIIIYKIYPMIWQLVLGFTDRNLIKAKWKFIGIRNYTRLFEDMVFTKSLVNTFVYTFFSVIITLGLALLLAFTLTSSNKINNFTSTIMFLPHITAMLSVSIVFLWLMDPQVGIFNYVLRLLGFKGLQWLESSKTSMMSIIIVSVFKGLGYYAIVLMSAITAIPKELYEAAALDKASRWKTFTSITIPMISPTLFFLLVNMTIGSFKVFDVVNIMTQGGPALSTNVLVQFIYENAFQNFKTGYACAAGNVLLLILGLLTILYFRLLAKRVHYK